MTSSCGRWVPLAGDEKVLFGEDHSQRKQTQVEALFIHPLHPGLLSAHGYARSWTLLPNLTSQLLPLLSKGSVGDDFYSIDLWEISGKRRCECVQDGCEALSAPARPALADPPQLCQNILPAPAISSGASPAACFLRSLHLSNKSIAS